nr:WecB/TagA/CpsF family glycosyltransferase [uncultured Albidiferax sp.]
MQTSHKIEKLPLAGYPIVSTSSSALSAILQDRLRACQKTVLLFSNTNFVLQCQSMRPWLRTREVILVNDGIGMDIAAKIIHGHRYKENLNGTDFLPHLLKNLDVSRKIFLLGGKPGVAEKAAVIIEKEFGQKVVGSLNGYSQMAPSAVCDTINAAGADIVLVAMGNPLQEKWIQTHMHTVDAKLFVGVGALFDFLSGGVKRAPGWVQKIRCEWLFRLSQEPKRLLRRYTLDIFSFLFLCITYRSKPD